jgi:hypothetical protein
VFSDDVLSGISARLSSRAVRALVLAAVAIAAIPAIASADRAAEARFHDERARAHYAARRYDDAVEEFFLEQSLAPNPRIVFNIALCFERLGRREDAYMFYAEYLASSDADAERRTQVEGALARLAPAIARVRIESDPAGAEIYVDERAHGSYGTTPRVLALAPGAHRVWLERDGHRAVELEVTAVRGEERTVEGTLAAVTGTLRVEASATGEVVVRDDAGASVASGASPLEAALPPGSYTIEVDAGGHRPFRAIARVEADAARTVEAALEALPAATGEITVTSNVAGAVVELDGQAAGFAPVVLDEVPAGAHALSVRSEGLADWSGEIEVEEDVRSWVTVQLEPPSRTTRSDWTWVSGGVGVGALVAWAPLLGISVATHDRFDAMPSMALRSQGEAIDVAADVTLAVGLAALGTAVVLYFVTERTEERESDATTSRQAR